MDKTYLADFKAWIDQTTQLLRDRHWHEIDVEHLIEEIEDWGKVNGEGLRVSSLACCSICSSGIINLDDDWIAGLIPLQMHGLRLN